MTFSHESRIKNIQDLKHQELKHRSMYMNIGQPFQSQQRCCLVCIRLCGVSSREQEAHIALASQPCSLFHELAHLYRLFWLRLTLQGILWTLAAGIPEMLRERPEHRLFNAPENRQHSRD